MSAIAAAAAAAAVRQVVARRLGDKQATDVDGNTELPDLLASGLQSRQLCQLFVNTISDVPRCDILGNALISFFFSALRINNGRC